MESDIEGKEKKGGKTSLYIYFFSKKGVLQLVYWNTSPIWIWIWIYHDDLYDFQIVWQGRLLHRNIYSGYTSDECLLYFVAITPYATCLIIVKNARDGLTHLPLDKLATVLQIILSEAFREWKFCILIKISLKCVAKGPNWKTEKQPSIGLDNGLAPNRRQAIIWNNADLIDWRIYATLGGDKLLNNVGMEADFRQSWTPVS